MGERSATPTARADGLDSDDAPLAPVTLTHVPPLDSLALLVTIARTGSLGRAGRLHGLGQPAVSARVRAIEALLGFPVVERGPRGSHLTPAGVTVLEWARPLLDHAHTFERGVRSLRADRRGRLRVAASLTIAEHLVPGWLASLHHHDPSIEITLEAVNSAVVMDRVQTGEADLGFVEGRRSRPSLASRVVGDDELCLVVAPSHPWARRRTPVSPKLLATTPLVQREALSGTREVLESALRSALGVPASADIGMPALLELSSTTAVSAAVAAGAGPTVLSRIAVAGDLARGRLVEVPLTGLDLTRRLRAVWRRGQPPSSAALSLLQRATN